MTIETEAAARGEKSRVRSPNFPFISLRDAIDRVEIIYKFDKRSPASAEVIVGHLGYKKAHGSSRRVLSALRQFGLLEERPGDLYRVSDLAYKLLHLPADTQERAALLKEAAQSPPIFKEILSIYQGELPSDPTLKSYLIINAGFNPDGAAHFIHVLRETLAYANISPEDYSQTEVVEAVAQQPNGAFNRSSFEKDLLSTIRGHSSPPAPLQPKSAADSVLVFKISKDSEAQIVFSGQVTQQAISKLIALLDLSKDAYPEKPTETPEVTSE